MTAQSNHRHLERDEVERTALLGAARVRIDLGVLAVLIALAGLGAFTWEWVLLGWGVAEVILSAIDIKEGFDA